MKTITSLLGAVALIFAVQAFAQPEGPPGQSGPVTDPSGAGVQPGAPTPGGPSPVDITGGAQEGSITITISKTITNDPNAITIVGTVDSEQQKQDVQTRLQELLPGKMVNNHLMVSNQTQTVTEPAGAEPQDQDLEKSEPQEEEQPLDDATGTDADAAP